MNLYRRSAWLRKQNKVRVIIRATNNEKSLKPVVRVEVVWFDVVLQLVGNVVRGK
jgi:hypothetical protein